MDAADPWSSLPLLVLSTTNQPECSQNIPPAGIIVLACNEADVPERKVDVVVVHSLHMRMNIGTPSGQRIFEFQLMQDVCLSGRRRPPPQ